MAGRHHKHAVRRQRLAQHRVLPGVAVHAVGEQDDGKGAIRCRCRHGCVHHTASAKLPQVGQHRRREVGQLRQPPDEVRPHRAVHQAVFHIRSARVSWVPHAHQDFARGAAGPRIRRAGPRVVDHLHRRGADAVWARRHGEPRQREQHAHTQGECRQHTRGATQGNKPHSGVGGNMPGHYARDDGAKPASNHANRHGGVQRRHVHTPLLLEQM